MVRQTFDVQLTKEMADHVRYLICKMCYISKSGHVGSSLSAADIIATLYFSEIDSERGDTFILSKGHAAPALYATLMLKGIINKSLIGELRKFGSPLQGHVDVRFLPEVNLTTGALGQGLSVALGRALAAKKLNKEKNVFCLVGDGESQEGQIWEAAMFGGNNKIDNLIAFTDYNKKQSDGSVKDIMDLSNLADKWNSFKWNVAEIDGQSIVELHKALQDAKEQSTKPTMIIAHTTKGYISPHNVLTQVVGEALDEDIMAEIKTQLKI